MRKIVLQMMTTLNGRLDDPMAWVHGVSDDQYRDIDHLYAGYDTVLVGRTTYEEMAGYWPGALSETVGTETNRSMARRMHAYRKIVFTRSGGHKLSDWNNTEQVVVESDAALAKYLTELKAQPGADVHVSGGATLAQAVIALDLVDEFHFFVYPIVSPGVPWFAKLRDKRELKLLTSSSYESGVVRLSYAPRDPQNSRHRTSFSDLLT